MGHLKLVDPIVLITSYMHYTIRFFNISFGISVIVLHNEPIFSHI